MISTSRRIFRCAKHSREKSMLVQFTLKQFLLILFSHEYAPKAIDKIAFRHVMIIW